MEKAPEGQSPRPSNGRSSSLSMPEGTASLSAACKHFTSLPSSPSHLGGSDFVPNVLVVVLCPNPGRASIIGSESSATKRLLLNAANRCTLPKAFDQADSPCWATALLGQMGLQEGWFSFHIYLLSAVQNTVLKERRDAVQGPDLLPSDWLFGVVPYQRLLNPTHRHTQLCVALETALL